MATVKCLACGYEGDSHEAGSRECFERLRLRLDRAEIALTAIKANNLCVSAGLVADQTKNNIDLAAWGLGKTSEG